MRSLFAALILLAGMAALMAATVARAQTTEGTIGTPDTVFTASTRTPISYITSYDRDVSTGTWSQSLSYSFFRTRVALSTSGNYSTVEQVGRPGLGAGSGSFSGRLDLQATKNWIVSADGRFNKASSRDIVSESNQRQNRLKVSTQYSLAPWKALGVRAVLSSEFQEDHSLALRPPGQGIARVLANGDTFYVARDSTLTSGRQDGLDGQVDWKPKPWLRMLTTASGNRIRPTTTSHLGGSGAGSSLFEHRTEKVRGIAPNDNYQYQSKTTYNGPRGLLTWLSLSRARSDQAYYDRTALRQEIFSSDRRGADLHLEEPLVRGMVISLDGGLSRFLGQYLFRNTRNSLLSSKTGKASLNYNPSAASRAGLDFEVDYHRNSRQQNGNGTNVSRFLQATGGHRVTRRLSLDAVATASLTSFQYVDSVLDQDNGRGYVNVGGGYQVSDRCSTLVHFSVSRGHSVAIDPSRSSGNNVQATYQMDASMRLGVTSRLSINQVYLLNALYQIYDAPSAESKNVLSRIRRIDTYMSDSLFQFATIQLIHNFLSRDFGSFSRPAGESQRLYRIFSTTYVQTVSATLNIKPVTGVSMFVTQSLSNTRIASTGGTTLNNRWNLALGATIARTILGDASLNGTVQHIGAYDERNLPTDPMNEQDDWIAGVTFVKDF